MDTLQQLSSLTVKQLKDKLNFLRNQVKSMAGKNPTTPEERRAHSRALNAIIDEIEEYDREFARRPKV
jgi:hypothetical protein